MIPIPIPIHRTKIEQLIRSQRRAFFSVVFIKKDGSQRYILCLLPKPKLQPISRRPVQADTRYILVSDVLLYRKYLQRTNDKLFAQNNSYRLINLATVVSFKLAKQQYVVVD